MWLHQWKCRAAKPHEESEALEIILPVTHISNKVSRKLATNGREIIHINPPGSPLLSPLIEKIGSAPGTALLSSLLKYSEVKVYKITINIKNAGIPPDIKAK